MNLHTQNLEFGKRIFWINYTKNALVLVINNV